MKRLSGILEVESSGESARDRESIHAYPGMRELIRVALADDHVDCAGLGLVVAQPDLTVGAGQ